MPAGTPATRVDRFVAEHRDWIERQLEVWRERLAAHAGSGELRHGALIPLRGKPTRLHVVEVRTCASAQIREIDRGLKIELPGYRGTTSLDAVIQDALQIWLRRQARQDVCALVQRRGRPHGLVPRAIRIKAQRTIWGSCTHNGVISINWRLILAPPHVLDYVVVHELCHLEIRHHQQAFWRRVEEIMPDYMAARLWLKEHGPLLTLKPRRP